MTTTRGFVADGCAGVLIFALILALARVRKAQRDRCGSAMWHTMYPLRSRDGLACKLAFSEAHRVSPRRPPTTSTDIAGAAACSKDQRGGERRVILLIARNHAFSPSHATPTPDVSSLPGIHAVHTRRTHPRRRRRDVVMKFTPLQLGRVTPTIDDGPRTLRQRRSESTLDP